MQKLRYLKLLFDEILQVCLPLVSKESGSILQPSHPYMPARISLNILHRRGKTTDNRTNNHGLPGYPSAVTVDSRRGTRHLELNMHRDMHVLHLRLLT